MHSNHPFTFILFKKNWKYDITPERLILPDFIIFFIINIAVYFIIDVTDDCFKAPESVPAMTLINNSSVLPVLPSVVSLTVKESPVEVTMLESRSVRAPGSSSRTSSGMDFFLAFSEIFILVIMNFALFRLSLIV